jgi:hypothetical protein
MTRALAVAVVAVVTMICGLPQPAHAEQAQPEIAFRLTDSRIIESSGLAASTRHKGVVWTHNDSGGGPRLYAVNSKGRTLARLTLADLDPYDWEGLATGPDHTLWIGDIGDNSQRRETIALFRVTEPVRLENGAVEWTRFRFRYPDGAHDAEAVLVHPQTGRIYVATKGMVGGGLYVGPERLRTGTTNDLSRVAGVPPLVTDGAFAPDGSRFALRGYRSAWLFAKPGDQIDRIGLPEMEQGESLTFSSDGQALLAGSEGADSPVWRVPLSEPAAAGPATPSTSESATPAAVEAEPDAPAAPAPSVVPMLAAGAGVAVALATIGVTLRRRRLTRGG